MSVAGSLANRRVVLGVSGGIAAYKAAELCRELSRRGADLEVAMTRGARQFVTPLTFSGLLGKKIHHDMFDAETPGEIHVRLGDWAELVVVAPATASLLERLVSGSADDVLTATILCTRAPVLLAPAMHSRMWEHPATRANVATLEGRPDVHWVGPTVGPLASGAVGIGRMSEPVEIAEAAARLLRADLAGRTIVVTAGPTLEDLDPVRFLGNRSSGRMGFAIASAAHRRGAGVRLIAGPTPVAPPSWIATESVRSALEMEAAVMEASREADAVVMAAAVADYRPREASAHKIKRTGGAMTLELEPNPDILARLGKERRGTRPLLVGFAVETDALIEHARKKLTEKRVDLVVANTAAAGFAGESTQATLVSASDALELPPMSKAALADVILDRVAERLAESPK